MPEWIEQPQILSLIIQIHVPLSTSYANGGPIIKANGARNGKPTGHREVRLNFPQGLGLIWMPTMMTKHSNNRSAQ